MTLPDVFQDHDKPERMYAAAGLDAKGIVAKALAALGKIDATGVEPDRVSEASAGERRGAERSRANVAALIAIVVLALLGYWAFTAIDHQRRLQRCLDEGRHNCLEIQAEAPCERVRAWRSAGQSHVARFARSDASAQARRANARN